MMRKDRDWDRESVREMKEKDGVRREWRTDGRVRRQRRRQGAFVLAVRACTLFGWIDGARAGGIAARELSAHTSARSDYLSAGEYHTCAVDKDGILFCWGSNAYARLGIGSGDTGKFSGGQFYALKAQFTVLVFTTTELQRQLHLRAKLPASRRGLTTPHCRA